MSFRESKITRRTALISAAAGTAALAVTAPASAAGLSPTIRDLAERHWHAHRACLTADGEGSEEVLDALLDRMIDTMVNLVTAKAETPADLAEQARALYRDTLWIDGSDGDFTRASVTVPALFRNIERVTGRTVCDNRPASAVEVAS